MMKKIKIIGSGTYLPDNIIESENLEKKFNIPKGWSEKYSGVKQRHYITSETGAYMGARALESALKYAGIDYNELDLIISASGSFDHPIPHNSCLIQNEMGKFDDTIPSFDIDSTCLGFITSFDTISYMLDGDRYKKIAIVCSEVVSKNLDPNDWETQTLFGDGAVAFIFGLPKNNETSCVIAADTKTYPLGSKFAIVNSGGSTFPSALNQSSEYYAFKMDGKKLIKLAIEHLKAFGTAFFDKLPIKIQELDLIIPHQASRVALNFFKKTFDLRDDKVFINLESRGNMLSASIPLALHEAITNKKIKRGDKILLIGTGAGFSIGALLLEY